MGIVEIDKENIPYEFEINFNGQTFSLTIKYNTIGDFFTIDLKKNETVIVLGEPLIYGVILFDRYRYLGVPDVILVPYSEYEVGKITFDNLGKDTFLYVIRESDIYVD